jgi:DNA repair protein SbcC/Rad50
MRIRKIRLENIRSYTSKEIDFPDGSVLLSGNIGSGKTTLLLAIDFVLFGLRKGNLSGGGLLRKGQETGSVELSFELLNKEITIKRNLKRTSKGFSQEAGYIIVDGLKEDLSPVELKQRILELFNYPRESLTKAKELVYNYTVYTPQEEMKSIVTSNSEDRLNILRRVFGIDKYKRILENSKILISKLKDRKKEFELLSSDLDSFKEEKLSKEVRLAEINSSMGSFKSELNEYKVKIEEKRNTLGIFERESNKRLELNKDLEMLNNKLESFVNQKSRDKRNIGKLNGEINILSNELREHKTEDLELINKKILNIEEDVRRIELENRENHRKIGELEFSVKASDKMKGDILQLDVCPICKQEVTQDHKHTIKLNENVKLKEVRELLENYILKDKENGILLSGLKTSLGELNQIKNKSELFKVKRENLDSKTKLLDELLAEQNRAKEKIGEINSQKIGLNSALEQLPDLTEKYGILKKELDILLDSERKINSQFFASEREAKLVGERILELKGDIAKKEGLKESVVKYSQTISFLEKDFNSIVSLIEKQIMKRVHSDFDKLFKDWFKILVENEDLEISLGYDFGMMIKQNGYDIDYDHLSGGERTAAALAYRLALNQVINTIMSEINTRDILILDEPTDGFSTEQVDKLRIILEEINIKQIIIVSHDPKIESFVDSVLRFEKKEGESFVF